MGGNGDGRKAACDTVVRKFPFMAGVRPRSAKKGDGWVHTFVKSVETSPGGPKIRQTVHVTVDANGRVKKVAASK